MEMKCSNQLSEDGFSVDFSEFLFMSYNANILFSTLHMYCKYRIREALRRLHILTAFADVSELALSGEPTQNHQDPLNKQSDIWECQGWEIRSPAAAERRSGLFEPTTDVII